MLKPTCTTLWMLAEEASTLVDALLILILEVTTEGLMTLLEERLKNKREEERRSLLATVPEKERQGEGENWPIKKSAKDSGRPDARTSLLPSARPGVKEELDWPEKQKKMLERRGSATREEEGGTLGGDESTT